MRINEVYDGNGNVIESTPVPYTAEELASALAERRYAVETGGLLVINGATIGTDQQSRANLTAAYIKAKEDNAYAIQWKAEGGFVTLDAAAVIAVADMVAAHVQQAFSAEATVAADLANYNTPQEVFDAFDAAFAGA